MILRNLKLESFDQSRNVILVEADGQRRKVSASAAVLRKAFITRAWLDRTLVSCAVGKCRLEAEAEQRGNQWVATQVWLAMEKSVTNESKSMFKNFGLELNKPALNPQKTGSNLFDISKMDEPITKLGARFSPEKNDLCNFRFDNEFLEKLAARNLKNAAAIAPSGLIQVDFTPDWRMVTGMGEASVYKTNMTLHPVYGVPYIPASSIKGILRHYLSEFEEGQKHIEKIFGKNDEESSTKNPVRGQCIFFDAFPTKAPRIELDVMTPHYPKYYGEGQPPADWQSPTPIHFLTVGQGTPFRFLIGLPDNELKEKLETWLIEALTTRGLGAKSAVGYGYWKPYNAEQA
ncbi:MAG: type III-B CRISPR module RAMP protein Cmr6 [Saprospiraceae bacterium]|nr:type III-B CRISPR module RAMP protein Cmr6 [Saprospiraceae bacterium]